MTLFFIYINLINKTVLFQNQFFEKTNYISCQNKTFFYADRSSVESTKIKWQKTSSSSNKKCKMRYTKIKFMKCMLSSLIASSLFWILNTQVPYKQVRWSLNSLKHNITIYGFTCVVNTVLILPLDNVSR